MRRMPHTAGISGAGGARRLSEQSGARNEGKGAPFLHSFHKAFPGAPPKVHVRGEGVYVYDQDGKKILDGLAGLWSVSLGYGQTRIVDAAAKQVERLQSQRPVQLHEVTMK